MSNTKKEYWSANLKLIAGLIVIWFVVPFLGGIVFVDLLNEYRLGGYKLGFWVAQQGAIYMFVALVFIYAWRADVLDKKYSDGGDYEP